MSEWLRPLKLREYYMDHYFDDVMEVNYISPSSAAK